MKNGYLYIAVAVVMFTSFEVVLKFIAGQINPVQLTLCRFAIGFVFLLPVALHNLKKRGKQREYGLFCPARADWYCLVHANSANGSKLHKFLRSSSHVQL